LGAASSPPDARALLGPLGQRLAARGLERPGAERAAARARVALRAEGLDHAARTALEDVAGASLTDRADGALELDAPEAALEALAPAHPALALALAAHRAACAPVPRPRMMGVVNATPDSFSDGGRWLDPGRAASHALELTAAGAELIDVGGESTRPGAPAVDAGEERARVVPVIERLAGRTDAQLSIDTSKAAVAEAALDAGAHLVNDVTAGTGDARMLPLVAERGCGLVLMHMLGTPRDMQANPQYDEVVSDVTESLRVRAAECLAAGIDPARLLVDPGIGFGKRLEHNLELLRRLHELRSLGLGVLLGVSLKSFLGALTGEDDPARRTWSTAAAVTAGVLGGAEVLRVHHVAEMRDASLVAHALSGGTGA
jgi:dihydropteroate synthase